MAISQLQLELVAAMRATAAMASHSLQSRSMDRLFDISHARDAVCSSGRALVVVIVFILFICGLRQLRHRAANGVPVCSADALPVGASDHVSGRFSS